MKSGALPRIPRRTALQWMLGAAAGTLLAEAPLPAAPRSAGTAANGGYGTDPDLTRIYRPGELWPLTLTDAQRKTAAALCDVIIPADDQSPAASAVGVVDFIDEWVSAPYPVQQRDRTLVLDGLAWIDAESGRRRGRTFDQLATADREAITAGICWLPAARPELCEAARFFSRYRELTTGGFYTTPEGSRDLGYVGNVPSLTFEGPPPDLIRRLGLEDA